MPSKHYLDEQIQRQYIGEKTGKNDNYKDNLWHLAHVSALICRRKKAKRALMALFFGIAFALGFYDVQRDMG